MELIENDYIKFFELHSELKTRLYHVLNKKSNMLLGIIKWYGPWRQYCFFPEESILFNIDCLETITKNLKILNEEKR